MANTEWIFEIKPDDLDDDWTEYPAGDYIIQLFDISDGAEPVQKDIAIVQFVDGFDSPWRIDDPPNDGDPFATRGFEPIPNKLRTSGTKEAGEGWVQIEGPDGKTKSKQLEGGGEGPWVQEFKPEDFGVEWADGFPEGDYVIRFYEGTLAEGTVVDNHPFFVRNPPPEE